MNLKLNGQSADVADDATVADLLGLLEVDPDRRGIAVAIDAEVVPRSEWVTRQVREGDNIEVLSAIQGG